MEIMVSALSQELRESPKTNESEAHIFEYFAFPLFCGYVFTGLYLCLYLERV